MLRTNAVTHDDVTGQTGTFTARNHAELLRFMENENITEVDVEYILYGQTAHRAHMTLEDVREIVLHPERLDD